MANGRNPATFYKYCKQKELDVERGDTRRMTADITGVEFIIIMMQEDD